jgi:hypothetical protein
LLQKVKQKGWDKLFGPDELGKPESARWLVDAMGTGIPRWQPDYATEAVAMSDINMRAAASSIGFDPSGRGSRFDSAAKHTYGDQRKKQSAIGKKYGVSGSQFSDYKSGDGGLAVEKIERITIGQSHELGVSPLWLGFGDAYGLSNWESQSGDQFREAVHNYIRSRPATADMPHLPDFLRPSFLAIESARSVIRSVRAAHSLVDTQAQHKPKGNPLRHYEWMQSSPTWDEHAGRWIYRLCYYSFMNPKLMQFPVSLIPWIVAFPSVYSFLKARAGENILQSGDFALTRDDADALMLAYDLRMESKNRFDGGWTPEATAVVEKIMAAAGLIGDATTGLLFDKLFDIHAEGQGPQLK